MEAAVGSRVLGEIEEASLDEVRIGSATDLRSFSP